MSSDEKCIFCKIVARQAPSSILYEDKDVLAFLDIRPLNMGHALVIPKAHYVDIFDTPEPQIGQVHQVAKKLSTAIKKATNADGISIIQQSGAAAGQDIFHIHVHVVPRFAGQTLPRFSELKEVSRSALDEMAHKIKVCLLP
ncbi:MAG: HIT family protein [Candidatus Bathyarchaeota archaeon]|nr:HIT family protein [Candidatus Bathyarchaeota archaeon]